MYPLSIYSRIYDQWPINVVDRCEEERGVKLALDLVFSPMPGSIDSSDLKVSCVMTLGKAGTLRFSGEKGVVRKRTYI